MLSLVCHSFSNPFHNQNSLVMKNQIVLRIAAVMVLVLAQSCAPVFSEMQTARLAGVNHVELTPYYSSTGSGNKNEDVDYSTVQSHIGLQAAFGILPEVDIRFRYENVWESGGKFGDGISLIGVGPKISFIKDKLAMSLPIGTALGDGVTDSWQFQPSLLGTLPVIKDKIDFTVAPKYVVQFCEECDNFLAFNTGLSFSKDLSKWALRTEYGRLFYGKEQGGASHFSVGFSVNLGKR
jgi:hypothetical protein